MFKKFIERPVLSTVISVILVILGILGLFKLPLQQFPDIAPPAVLVFAVYPGANAETILRSVAPSLEEAINGVEGMTYMSSTASNDGTLSITVYFDQGVDPDQAQINVQNRVSTAQSQLPAEVLQQGITTIKQRNGFISAIGIYSTDQKRYDQAFLTNYAQINIIPEIKRIRGIASVVVFGGVSDYAMRIWLNPGQMAAYHITPGDIQAAIQDKNLEAAPGKFGERSDESFEFVIKYQGKFITPEEYGNIPLRTNPDGSVLRLKNVARLELGAYSYTSTSHANGNLAMGFGIIQLAGSNSNDIQIALDNLMQKASKNFPQGIHYNNFYRTKTSLDESITQVKHTLIEAFVLVFIVVFIFLQDFRSTLIPAIAVPVAILGTFFFLNLLGFSINLLTLFALVLAIGIVVDDAIVVVEAVHSKMEEEHLDAGSATVSAMREISGAIISITLVMAAVFLPVGFLTGSTGIFYRQFAFTMAIAILISAVNALTLSPALAALFLKGGHEHGGHPVKQGFAAKFNRGFNRSFQSLTERYTGGLRYLTAHKWVAITGLILITAFTVYLVRTTRTGFIPTEDQGFIAIFVSTPSGTSLSKTSKVIADAEAKLRAVPSARFVFSVSGLNLLTNSSSPSAGVVFVLLNDDKERGAVKDINAIQENIRGQLRSVPGGSFFVFEFPTVPGFSNVEALDFVLQDKSGGNLERFSTVSGKFIAKLMQKPAVAYAQRLTAAALVPRFEQEISITENSLSVLCGKLPEAISRHRTLDKIIMRGNLSAGVPLELLSIRPEVRAAEIDVDRANAEVGYSKAHMYPSLTITAEGGLNAFRASNWFSLPASLFGAVAGGITQPVFQRKALRTRYEISKIEREKSIIRFRQQVLTAVQEVSDALIRIKKLDRQQDVVREKVTALRLATANANLLFKNGKATYLEVIIAQSSVLQSELDLAGIEKAGLDARVDLYRSVGGGWR
ncbi:MMPL family transporter [Mucilaginibacter pallidiroseus]|uniref:MMPL family transporter n=1 Tax=Mucilaginibacter pallidiroseus TaxID=2599295 RepID=A0A563TYD4_9SPHI|nr:efflux RND transporter permease subunit [Mucilaginibacter pallidiroseus]TWR24378.1 MMPL family transporter [Mucilaginibacter pallidiroseus]